MEGVMADFADLVEVMASRSGDDGRQAVVEKRVEARRVVREVIRGVT